MPLVPKMISELVFALPPLGDARVLDLLCKDSETNNNNNNKQTKIFTEP